MYLPLFTRAAKPLLLALGLAFSPALLAQAPAPADQKPADAPTVPFMGQLNNVPADLAAMKARQIPMLLFFHASYCPYCQLVDSEFIQPMQDDPRYKQRLIVRRVMIDSDRSFLGRDGKQHSYMSLANRLKVRLVPVVLFIGPDGRQIGNPLRGVTVPDFYPYYLNQGIDLAEHCAKTPDDPTCRPDKDQRSL